MVPGLRSRVLQFFRFHDTGWSPGILSGAWWLIFAAAGSIELYLGRDVLTQPDGTLRPVRWTSYVSGMDRYQGQIVGKDAIHQAFRAKSKAACENPEHAERQDWSGLRLVIDAICAAAQRTRVND
jgi:hypothetical protein